MPIMKNLADFLPFIPTNYAYQSGHIIFPQLGKMFVPRYQWAWIFQDHGGGIENFGFRVIICCLQPRL